MTPELIVAVSNFGPLGLLVLFLYFEKKAEREHRREVELARAESDKALATSLAALTVTIEHFDRGAVMAAEHLEAIRSVHQAALQLTLACTEYVGPVSMAVSLTAARTLAEPLPRRLRRDVEAIEEREGK